MVCVLPDLPPARVDPYPLFTIQFSLPSQKLGVVWASDLPLYVPLPCTVIFLFFKDLPLSSLFHVADVAGDAADADEDDTARANCVKTFTLVSLAFGIYAYLVVLAFRE